MTGEAVTKLFDTVAPRFGDRKGGYTRIVRTAWRKATRREGIIELLGSEQVIDEKRQKRAEIRAKRARKTARRWKMPTRKRKCRRILLPMRLREDRE